LWSVIEFLTPVGNHGIMKQEAQSSLGIG